MSDKWKYRIKTLYRDNGTAWFYVQRKENKWWKFLWETVCIQRHGITNIMTFSTKENAQQWINRQK